MAMFLGEFMSLHCRMLWPKKETQCPNKNLGGGPQTIGSFNSGLVALVLTSGQHLLRRKCLVGIVTLRLLYYGPLFYPLQSAGESLEWQGSREKSPVITVGKLTAHKHFQEDTP